MPIISRIGSRSLKVQLVYAAIFLILSAGAVTMLYPLALMLSGSVKSETDFINITPYPKFWTSDHLLFQKYCESKYNVTIVNLEQSWQEKIASWRLIKFPELTPQLQRDLDDFLAWNQQFEMPAEWYWLGHTTGGNMLPINARLFRKAMSGRFEGDIDRFQHEMNVYAQSWSMVDPARDYGYSRNLRPLAEPINQAFQDFKTKRPVHDRVVINLDAAFWAVYLQPKYPTIENYNELHDTAYSSYKDVFLTTRVPAGGLARDDWEYFVRKELSPVFLQLDVDDQLNAAFRTYLLLNMKYPSIKQFNTRHRTSYASFDEIVCPLKLPDETAAQLDWQGFIAATRQNPGPDQQNDAYLFPSEHIRIHSPRQAFEQFVAQRRGLPLQDISPLPLPIAAADWHDCMSRTRELRWEFTTRNYKQVFDYILLHGRGVVNTLIYCSLAIAVSLLVNPLAAYALSRYKPPSQYTVLLFCMVTMAFPPAVTMIPAFLLLKHFPLWPIVGGLIAFFVLICLTGRFTKTRFENLRLILSLGIAVMIGYWLVPALTGKPTISLLNTFACLVLPSMANGYFIFLLKGFFDSLPRELYEAADLDGASEWNKFWLLTMGLSTPILAIIALGAFTAAYSNFMMAIILVPDRSMWTLMVWIYQMQSGSHQTVAYAALVVAAIPTMLVFILCQNIILRGIVIPSEK